MAGPIDTVLLDYGGTLDAPGVHWLERFQALYRRFGLAVEFAKVQEAYHFAEHTIHEHHLADGLPLHPLCDLHVSLQFQHLACPNRAQQALLSQAFYQESAQMLRENVALLARLRGRVQLGIISNFFGNLSTICDEFALTPLMAVIIDSEVVGVRKPDRRIFDLALERLGGSPQQALYVGDSFERDMMGAKEAGLQTVWLVGDGMKDCPQPHLSHLVDRHIHRLSELPALLDTWGGQRGTIRPRQGGDDGGPVGQWD